jgi:hypothetical protein
MHIKSMFEIALEKYNFKVKMSFWTKALFLSFCKKCILAIFRIFLSLKALLFFLPNEYCFLQTDFLNIKSIFRPLKYNLK